MSEEAGGFLTRWSRRKAASLQPPAPKTPETPDPALEEAAIELPAMETLGADSDYTAFLTRGVSQAVQAQALSIAWASDPAIANFRGMAEYAWDFNAPGYGDLAPGDDAAVWLSQIVRSGAKILATAIADAPSAEDGLQYPAQPADLVPATPVEPPSCDSPQEQPVAMIAADIPIPGAPNLDAPIPVPVRRHGGAMPV